MPLRHKSSDANVRSYSLSLGVEDSNGNQLNPLNLPAILLNLLAILPLAILPIRERGTNPGGGCPVKTNSALRS